MIYDYSDTHIGRDYMKKPKFYKTDLLLEFLSGLLNMRAHIRPESRQIIRYDREIAAVKEVLKMQVEANRF